MRTLGEWQSENGPTKVVDFKTIDDQLRYLRELISTYRQAPSIRNLAVEIIRKADAPIRDRKSQAIAIASWVRANIFYVHELPERFQTPEETLRLKAGDCDDFTTLIGSLLESVGIPTIMVTMSIDGIWSHIFPAARMKWGTLLPLDCTMRSDLTSGISPVEWARQRGKNVLLKLA